MEKSTRLGGIASPQRVKYPGVAMQDYIVTVTCTYPVRSLSAKDALSTVPMVVKIKIPNLNAKVKAVIKDKSSKLPVLKATLRST